jgi:hypothetical protein
MTPQVAPSPHTRFCTRAVLTLPIGHNGDCPAPTAIVEQLHAQQARVP